MEGGMDAGCGQEKAAVAVGAGRQPGDAERDAAAANRGPDVDVVGREGGFTCAAVGAEGGSGVKAVGADARPTWEAVAVEGG